MRFAQVGYMEFGVGDAIQARVVSGALHQSLLTLDTDRAARIARQGEREVAETTKQIEDR